MCYLNNKIIRKREATTITVANIIHDPKVYKHIY